MLKMLFRTGNRVSRVIKFNDRWAILTVTLAKRVVFFTQFLASFREKFKRRHLTIPMYTPIFVVGGKCDAATF